MRAHQHGRTWQQLGLPLELANSMSVQVEPYRLSSLCDNVSCPCHEPLKSERGIELEAQPVNFAASKSSDVQGSLSQRLRWDPRVSNRLPPWVFGPIDHSDTLAKVGRLGCPFFAGGPRADYDHVERVHSPPTVRVISLSTVCSPHRLRPAAAQPPRCRPRPKSSIRSSYPARPTSRYVVIAPLLLT
jgi:hypothetical protein